jgi:hypothetical protein
LKKIIYIFLSLLLLCGCISEHFSDGRYVLEANKQAKPVWVQKIPENKEYIVFLGLATEVTKIEEAEQKAKAMALQKMYEYLHITGKSEYSIDRTALGTTLSDKLEVTTPYFSLQNIKVIDFYYQKYKTITNKEQAVFDYYVLVGLPKSEIPRLERERKSYLNQAYKQYLAAKEEYNKKNAFVALEQINNAKKNLENVYTTTYISDDNGKTISNIDLKLILDQKLIHFKEELKTVVLKINEKSSLENNHEKTFLKAFSSKLTQKGFSLISEDKQNNLKYIHILGEIDTAYSGQYTSDMQVYRAKGVLRAVIWDGSQFKTISEFDTSSIKHIGSTPELASKSALHHLAIKSAEFFSKTLQ